MADGGWVEVWGIEAGETVKVYLFKFPPDQWEEGAESDFLIGLREQGVEDVEVRRVPAGE